MKRVILSVLLFCFMGSMASPTRSSVAARQSAIASDGEEVSIPYVTDGLVAMWDGIWNSGIDSHSSKPEAIKDLVGTHDLTLVYGGNNRGMAIGEDYFAPNNVYGGKVVNYDLYELRESILNGRFTIEICVRIDVKNGQLFLIDDNTRMYGASQYMSWLRVRGTLTNISTVYSVPGETTTFCIAGSTGNNKIFRDGIAMSSFNIGTQPIAEGIEFGQATAGGWIYHSIRIYDRALNAEEVEYNHLVDRERFGF